MNYGGTFGGSQDASGMMGAPAPGMGGYGMYGVPAQGGMMQNGQFTQTGPMGSPGYGMGMGGVPPRTPMSVSNDFDQRSAIGPARSVASAKSRASRGSARSRTSTEMDARAKRRAEKLAATGARRLNSAKLSDGAWKGVGYAKNDRPGTALTARSKHSHTGGSVASGRSKKSGVNLNVGANPKYGTRRRDDKDAGVGLHGLQGELKQDAGRRRVRKVLARQQLSHEEDRIDFKSLDYTPITTRKPVDMRYPLRLRRQGLHIELAICVTVPGHDEGAGKRLRKTLRAVAAELTLIQARSSIPWAEIAVCVIVDGRARMSRDLADLASRELRVFDASMLELRYAGSDTTMHVFERSVELPRHTAAREYFPPLQLIFGVKEHGGGQLHSLLWFYTGFCKQLQPTYCMVLESGVVPRPGCISRLVLAMDFDPQVGGVTPELAVQDFEPWSGWHWLQFFAYKYQAAFEQPMESIIGFVPRVPNACAAWRWMAIRGEPLATILWAEERADKLGPGESQALLGYDRTLPLEVMTKKARRWKVQFESLAVADVPCPDSLPDLMEEERKKINGQIYADAKYFVTCPEHLCCRSNHTICRKCCFSCQYVERAMTSTLRFLFPANLFLAYSILMTIALESVPDIGETLGFVFTTGFLFLVVLQVFLGLGAYKAHSVAMVYYVSALLFVVLMVVFLSLSVYLANQNGLSDIVFYAGLAGAGLYLLCAILMMQPVSVVTSSIVAAFMAPIITVMMPVYAISKLSLTAADTVREERLAFDLARPEQQLAQRRESMKAAVVRHLATGEGGVDIHAALAEIKQAHADVDTHSAAGSGSQSGSVTGPGGAHGGKRASVGGMSIQDEVDDARSEAPAGRRASMEPPADADGVAVASGGSASEQEQEQEQEESKREASGDSGPGEDLGKGAAHEAAGPAPAPEPGHQPHSSDAAGRSTPSQFRVEDLVVEAASEVELQSKRDRGSVRGPAKKRRGSFSSQASGASKAQSVAMSIQSGTMARIDTKRGQLRSRTMGRKASGKKSKDQTIAQLSKGKKQPKLVLKDEKGKSASLPADVGFVIRECRSGVQRGHQAVLNALRREGDRVLAVNKKAQALQQEKREDYSAFRTRTIALYLAVNYLWVSVIQYFGLTGLYAAVAASAITFYILTRFLGVLLYTIQVVFLNTCLDSCAAVCCCCKPCRMLGRACGRTLCACCYRCAGPEPADAGGPVPHGASNPATIKAGKSGQADGDEGSDGDGDGGRSPGGAESKNAPAAGRRRRRASVVDFGGDGFATHVQDVEEPDQDEKAAQFMDAHEGASADAAEGEDVGQRRDKRSRSVVVPAAIATAAAKLKRKSAAAATNRRRNMRRSVSGTALEWLDHFKRGTPVGGAARQPGERGSELVDAFGNPIEYEENEDLSGGASKKRSHGKRRSDGGKSSGKRSSVGKLGDKDNVKATSHQPFAGGAGDEAAQGGASKGTNETRSATSASTSSGAVLQPRTTVPLKGKTYKLSDPSAMPHTIGEEEEGEEDEDDDARSRPTTGGNDDDAVVAAVMSSGYRGARGSTEPGAGSSGAAAAGAVSSWAADVAQAATRGDDGDDGEVLVSESGSPGGRGAREISGAVRRGGDAVGLVSEDVSGDADLDAELARLQRASEVQVSAARIAVAGSDADGGEGSGGAAPTPSGLPDGGW